MEIEINKEEFTKSNMLKLNSDVESVFRIDSNFGLQGQLLKLTKSNNLKPVESLSILLGRLACIGEEWNYNLFKKEEWDNIYNSKKEKTQNKLKEFKKSNAKLFMREFKEFKNYYVKKEFEQVTTSIKITPSFSSEYKFDGLNIKKYYDKVNLIRNPSLLKFDIFKNLELKTVLHNNKQWYWNLWYIETSSDNFLFERIIIN